MNLLELSVLIKSSGAARVKAEVTGIEKEMSKTSKTADEMARKVGSVFGKGITAGAAAIGVAVGGTVVALMKYNEQLKKIHLQADVFGISATQMYAYQLAAESAGASVEELQQAAQRVRYELSQGSDVFNKLGVNLRDTNGHLKTSSQLATEVAERYRTAGDSTRNAAHYQKILGEQSAKTAKGLVALRDADAMAQEMAKKGVIIHDSSKKAIDEYTTSTQRGKIAIMSMASQVSTLLTPALTKLSDAFVDSFVNGGSVFKLFQYILRILPLMVKGIAEVGRSFMDLVAAAELGTNFVKGMGGLIGEGGVGGFDAISTDEQRKNKPKTADHIKTITDAVNTYKTSIQQNADSVAALHTQIEHGISQATVDSNNLISDARKNGLNKSRDTGGGGGGGAAQVNGPTAAENAMAEYAKQLHEAGLLQKELTGHVINWTAEREKAATAAGRYGKEDNAQSQQKRENIALQIDAMNRENEAARKKNQIQDEFSKKVQEQREQVLMMNRAAAESIEEHRIAAKVMGVYGSTFEDVNLALAEYRMLQAQIAFDSETDVNKRLEAETRLFEARANMSAAAGQKSNADEIIKQQRTFSYGWSQAFKQYQDEAGNSAALANNAFGALSSTMEELTVGFLEGRKSFSELARSFISDILKMIARSLVLYAINSALGLTTAAKPAPVPTTALNSIGGSGTMTAANGAAFGWGGVQYFAKGGVFDKPTAFGYSGGRTGVLGEAGPEAIMPLTRGTDGKLGVKASGNGGGDVNIVIQQTNNFDGGSESVDQQAADDIMRSTKMAVRQVIAEEKRSGGMLAGVR